ncbi:MAG: hypothetical protein DWI11_01195 [Planctomycetota bacterium]|nr:MAG: hypothetical protein DWI11_01195 [Planctomycetota bacterium]
MIDRMNLLQDALGFACKRAHALKFNARCTGNALGPVRRACCETVDETSTHAHKMLEFLGRNFRFGGIRLRSVKSRDDRVLHACSLEQRARGFDAFDGQCGKCRAQPPLPSVGGGVSPVAKARGAGG